MKKITILLFLSTLIFADKTLEINLTDQTLTAKDGNNIALKSPICSGKVGYATPTGKFKILDKNKMHVSNRYPIVDKAAGIRGGAKMPYMLRVTNTGIAIHAGTMVKYPDSHGCIRIPYGKAMQLFKWTDVGTKVRIVGKAPYDDSVNKMRMSMLKYKKHSKPRKNRSHRVKKYESVRWVDKHLSYYDEL